MNLSYYAMTLPTPVKRVKHKHQQCLKTTYWQDSKMWMGKR